MNIFGETWTWLTTGSNWSGAGGVPTRLGQHVAYSAVAVAIAIVLAIPIALWLGHIGKGGSLAINISNVGRAVPTYALLIVLFLIIGITHREIETTIALVAFAIPPLLTNTYVGIREVDPEAREAARGMGMSGLQLLRRVEIPLAMPLIMDGLRIAVLQVIATTTIAALIGSGGLGRFIVDGFGTSDPGQYGGGAVIVAVLALLAEGGFYLVQRRVDRSRGLRPASRGLRARLHPAAD